MTAVLSRLARCIRDGSKAEKNAAWIALAADNGTGIARDIWAMAEREAAGLDNPAEPVQEELW
jgi:hypothetical protein